MLVFGRSDWQWFRFDNVSPHSVLVLTLYLAWFNRRWFALGVGCWAPRLALVQQTLVRVTCWFLDVPIGSGSVSIMLVRIRCWFWTLYLARFRFNNVGPRSVLVLCVIFGVLTLF